MATAFPKSYEEWHWCITEDCGIPLTADYVEARLAALRDRNDGHTAQFVENFGEEYLARVIGWFEIAAESLE